MYSSLTLVQKFARYYIKAHNGKGHGVHSPFAFDFILRVLNNRNHYIPPAEIEAMRHRLLKDERLLSIQDLGAGSRVAATKERRVKEVAQAALKSPKYAQLLYRLVRHYSPNTIIELGTSLGITTSYLAVAAPGAELFTIEGSEAVAAVAKENFASLGLNHIRLCQGSFDDELPKLLQTVPAVDLAYIDGNHRYAATIKYFVQLLPHLHNYSIVVFDDIHWSAEMEQAWNEIKEHPSVRCSIDVFFLGFVFFRREFKVKQHFAIRF